MELVICMLCLMLDVVAANFTIADCPRQPCSFIDGVCYWAIPNRYRTFFEARKTCRQQGGDLAVIPNGRVFWGLRLPSNWGKAYWLNLYDAYPGTGEAGLPREWITTTVGSMRPGINWGRNQPIGYAVGNEDSEVQDCVFIPNTPNTGTTSCMAKRSSVCSYDPSEPTHACIRAGDCMWDHHFKMLHHQYLEGVDGDGVGGYGIDHYGTVNATSQFECAVSCQHNPRCENIKWNPSSKQCQRLGHLTIVKHPYADLDWQLWSRYRFYDFSG